MIPDEVAVVFGEDILTACFKLSHIGHHSLIFDK